MRLRTGIKLAFLILLFLGIGQGLESEKDSPRRFEIDYDNDRFLKDGQPFRYVSGSIHYFRVLASDWADRLWKLRMAGFNAVQTVIEWSGHEPEPGQYVFSDNYDLETFIKTAQQQDLLVILRPGPFICADRDMGGFPYWLIRLHPEMRLRTADPVFLKYVDEWMSNVLLPKIKPLLYENGGPVIMIQLENEYGAGGGVLCDFAYTTHLRDLFRSELGPNVVLFTVDNPYTQNMRCGKIPEVYATVDFSPGFDPKEAFEIQRLFEPRGPLVNTEFHPGYTDLWGDPHHTHTVQEVAEGMDAILALNASVNMYMFHGGTSFGFSSGSTILSGKCKASPPNYDYDAPVSEAGDPTDKYLPLRQVVGKYLPLPPGPVPTVSPKAAYESVPLKPLGSVLQLAANLPSTEHTWPLTFEQMNVSTGLVVYETTVPFRIPDPARLTLKDVHDWGYVFVADRYVGLTSREESLYDLALTARPNQTLTVIVESGGRVTVGPYLKDFKGLTTNVTLNNHTLKTWKMTPVPLGNNIVHVQAVLQHLQQSLLASQDRMGTTRGGMTFYQGSFNVPEEDPHPLDTFLKLDGWTKGVAWVNNFCLGKYWPEVGPQVTLYVPRHILGRGTNTLLLLELEAAPCLTPGACQVTFQKTNEVDGPTPL